MCEPSRIIQSPTPTDAVNVRTGWSYDANHPVGAGGEGRQMVLRSLHKRARRRSGPAQTPRILNSGCRCRRRLAELVSIPDIAWQFRGERKLRAGRGEAGLWGAQLSLGEHPSWKPAHSRRYSGLSSSHACEACRCWPMIPAGCVPRTPVSLPAPPPTGRGRLHLLPGH